MAGRSLVSVAIFIIVTSSSCNCLDAGDNGDALLLTPLIRQGKIDEAQNRSLINPKVTTRFSTTISHSGFLTVDDRYSTNLFFWFVRAAVPDPDGAPLVVWLQGDGLSSLHGAFLENGPYRFKGEKRITIRRNTTWHRRANLLYLDPTAGVGFSHTSGAFANTAEQIGRELNAALGQFVKLFPRLKNNDVFVAGESDACPYVAQLCSTILRENTVKLQGFVLGNAYCDPVNQMKYGDYLYQLGLLGTKQMTDVRELEKKTVGLMRVSRWRDAADARADLNALLTRSTASLPRYENILDSDGYISAGVRLSSLIESPKTRLGLHVGSVPFNVVGEGFVKTFREEAVKSTAVVVLADLLTRVRGVFYSGQLDAKVPYVSTTEFLEAMRFPDAGTLGNAARTPWSVDGKLSGYARIAGKLTEVLVMDAGHWAGLERGDALYDLFGKLLDKKPIV